MRKILLQRLAKEYRYAANKMQESTDPLKKLYYFSVLYGEAQRTLNWEWDRDLALVHVVTQQAHQQINQTVQTPASTVPPIDWQDILDKLTQITSDIATYYENISTKSKDDLYQVLGRLAEVSYSTIGNGAYLNEKGHFKS
ncbi:MAG: hypothetical protein GY861_09640 [bacterium]|nr:hypothetical protein [bacterium]